MVCFTEAEDDLLASGWPRMVRLVDGHPHDRNPTKSALAWVASSRAKYFSDWPREVAYRALRAGPAFRVPSATASKVRLGPRDLAAISKSGPLPTADVKAALVSVVASLDAYVYESRVRDWIFIVEAVIGADETLEAIAEGFERSNTAIRVTATSWRVSVKQRVAATLGFLLLRVSKERAKEHAARLAEQHARFAAAAKTQPAWVGCVDAFDVSLNGAAAVKRRLGRRKSTILAEYAHDDPDYVRECVAEDATAPMSVRLVAIAGTGVMKGLAKRRWYAAELPSAMRDFGMVRAPETVELALSLFGKSAAKDAPIHWLTTHADYARPIVERAAKAGSASAKAALGSM